MQDGQLSGLQGISRVPTAVSPAAWPCLAQHGARSVVWRDSLALGKSSMCPAADVHCCCSFGWRRNKGGYLREQLYGTHLQ